MKTNEKARLKTLLGKGPRSKLISTPQKKGEEKEWEGKPCVNSEHTKPPTPTKPRHPKGNNTPRDQQRKV